MDGNSRGATAPDGNVEDVLREIEAENERSASDALTAWIIDLNERSQETYGKPIGRWLTLEEVIAFTGTSKRGLKRLMKDDYVRHEVFGEEGNRQTKIEIESLYHAVRKTSGGEVHLSFEQAKRLFETQEDSLRQVLSQAMEERDGRAEEQLRRHQEEIDRRLDERFEHRRHELVSQMQGMLDHYRDEVDGRVNDRLEQRRHELVSQVQGMLEGHRDHMLQSLHGALDQRRDELLARFSETLDAQWQDLSGGSFVPLEERQQALFDHIKDALETEREGFAAQFVGAMENALSEHRAELERSVLDNDREIGERVQQAIGSQEASLSGKISQLAHRIDERDDDPVARNRELTMIIEKQTKMIFDLMGNQREMADKLSELQDATQVEEPLTADSEEKRGFLKRFFLR